MNVPPQYQGASIFDFPEHSKAILDWKCNPDAGLMTLTGPAGTGKTRMLYAVSCLSVDPRHWDVPSLVRATQRAATMEPDAYNWAEAHPIDTLIKHKYVVLLDDLGAEKTTDFVLQEIYRLISQRELWGKATLFTTNLTLDDIAKKFDDRIASRLAGGIVLEFDGADRRLGLK